MFIFYRRREDTSKKIICVNNGKECVWFDPKNDFLVYNKNKFAKFHQKETTYKKHDKETYVFYKYFHTEIVDPTQGVRITKS